MRKIAGIDIGTNSVLYSLFDVSGQRISREVYFERHSPRIGSRLAGRRRPYISGENYENLKRILRKNIRHAQAHGSHHILIAATNPFRLARNGAEIRNRLAADLKYDITILSSEDEAHLSFLGAVGRLNRNQTAVIIDMGGGSTELAAYRGNRRLAFASVPEGAVSLTETFETEGRVAESDFASFEKYLSKYEKEVEFIRPYLTAPITLVGGTSSALGYLKNENFMHRPKGIILTRSDIDRNVALLTRLNLSCRRQLLTIDRKRAEIIFAGAFWYRFLFKILGIKKARATPCGLRHGMVLDFLERHPFTP